MKACSPTAIISISTNPNAGATTSTSILKLSGAFTSASMLLKVVSKNLAPDSVSSTIPNFADDMAAIFSPALVSTSLNTGVGVGVGVDSFAPTNSHFRYNLRAQKTYQRVEVNAIQRDSDKLPAHKRGLGVIKHPIGR